MGTKPKNETRPPEDDDERDDDLDDPEGDPGGGGDGGTDDERLTQRVENAVRKVLGGLLGGGGLDVQDGQKPEDDEPAPASRGRGAAAVEDDMESKVRNALASIRSDEDRDNRMKKLEETVFAERPPVKQRRVERAIWGPPRVDR